jgi:hypothetical protein
MLLFRINDKTTFPQPTTISDEIFEKKSLLIDSEHLFFDRY